MDVGQQVRRNSAAVGQEHAGVVEEDDAVTQQAPSLLGVVGDGVGRVAVRAVSGRTWGVMWAHCSPRGRRLRACWTAVRCEPPLRWTPPESAHAAGRFGGSKPDDIGPIPHYIVLFFLDIAAFVVVIVAWFAILFTGTYPRGMFDFVEGVIRWNVRVAGYALVLITDQYPPFRLAS